MFQVVVAFLLGWLLAWLDYQEDCKEMRESNLDQLFDPRKEYLGDSVYIQRTLYGEIVLTTENGHGPSNTIVLEAEVATALIDYVKRHRRPAASASDHRGGVTLL
jgi:hypothetical protein